MLPPLELVEPHHGGDGEVLRGGTHVGDMEGFFREVNFLGRRYSGKVTQLYGIKSRHCGLNTPRNTTGHCSSARLAVRQRPCSMNDPEGKYSCALIKERERRISPVMMSLNVAGALAS